MKNSFSEATINTNYTIFPYDTWTSRSNKNVPDNANKILSFNVKKGDRQFFM